MSEIAHHVLLGLAMAAIVSAALRLASRLGITGLERALTAAVFAVAAIIAETLALGLVGLGSSAAALIIAAALTWLAARWLLPRPAVRPADELRRAWQRLGGPARAAVLALVGGGLAFVAWLLRYPSIGFDSSIYHYAEIAGWIHNGHPGSILHLSYDLPYGNYPVTDEVAQTWGAAIARSFVPLSLWNPAMFVLLGLGTWQTLRRLRIPRGVRLLATASLLALPLLVHQLNEPQTDLPDMSWLACTAALALGTRQTPSLLAPTLVAAALAVGTKTTPGVMALGALALGVYYARGHLRRLAVPLLGAVALGIVVGGGWYLRNLLQHGSPVWPFAAAPWGDPMPTFLRLVNPTLISHPIATVRENLDGYGDGLAGGVVLLASVPVLLVIALPRLACTQAIRRPLLLVTALTMLAFLAFAAAPGTGPQRPGFWFGPMATLRYVLPTLAGAVVGLALATRAGGPLGILARIALVASLAWSLIQDRDLGFPIVPSARTLALGALAGLGVWAALTALNARRGAAPLARVRGLPPLLMSCAAAVVVGAGLAPAGNGYVARHARVDGSTALGQPMVAWFAAQPSFEGSHEPIAFVSRAVDAPLSGDHFTHRLTLIGRDADCATVQAAARHGLVVVTAPGFLRNFIGVQPYATAGCLAGHPTVYRDAIFTVYR